MWEKKWPEKRKQKANKLQKKPTISFRSNLSPESLGYIKKLASAKQKSRFINQAIEMRYFMETNKKGFLRQVIVYEYDLVKYLLRKIGGRNGVDKNKKIYSK